MTYESTFGPCGILAWIRKCFSRNIPSARASRRKGKISVGNSSGSAVTKNHSNAKESNVDESKKDSNPKRGDQKSAAKLRLKDRKLIFTLSKPQQTVTSASVESPKGSLQSSDVGRSTAEQNDNPGEASKEAKGSTSNSVEMNMDGEKGIITDDVATKVDGGEKGAASSNVETYVDREKGVASKDNEIKVDGGGKQATSTDVETNVDREEQITSMEVETNVDGGEKGVASKNVKTNVDGGEQGIAASGDETTVDGERRKMWA